MHWSSGIRAESREGTECHCLSNHYCQAGGWVIKCGCNPYHHPRAHPFLLYSLIQSTETYTIASTRDRHSDIEAWKLKPGGQHYGKGNSHTNCKPLPINPIPPYTVNMIWKEVVEHRICWGSKKTSKPFQKLKPLSPIGSFQRDGALGPRQHGSEEGIQLTEEKRAF